MHWKKYFILMPPALLIGLIFILYFHQSSLAFLTIIVFWGIYYLWVYIENKKKSKGKIK